MANNLKPSERIDEIHKALKLLDGQNPNDKYFYNKTFFEEAIINYLDEVVSGTLYEQRKNSKN